MVRAWQEFRIEKTYRDTNRSSQGQVIGLQTKQKHGSVGVMNRTQGVGILEEVTFDLLPKDR